MLSHVLRERERERAFFGTAEDHSSPQMDFGGDEDKQVGTLMRREVLQSAWMTKHTQSWSTVTMRKYIKMSCGRYKSVLRVSLFSDRVSSVGTELQTLSVRGWMAPGCACCTRRTIMMQPHLPNRIYISRWSRWWTTLNLHCCGYIHTRNQFIRHPIKPFLITPAIWLELTEDLSSLWNVSHYGLTDKKNSRSNCNNRRKKTRQELWPCWMDSWSM